MIRTEREIEGMRRVGLERRVRLEDKGCNFFHSISELFHSMKSFIIYKSLGALI